MYHTGMARKLDNLGRVVIPKEIRNRFQLKENDLLEIHMHRRSILLCFDHDDTVFSAPPARPLMREAISALSELCEKDFMLCLDIINRCAQVSKQERF